MQIFSGFYADDLHARGVQAELSWAPTTWSCEPTQGSAIAMLLAPAQVAAMSELFHNGAWGIWRSRILRGDLAVYNLVVLDPPGPQGAGTATYQFALERLPDGSVAMAFDGVVAPFNALVTDQTVLGYVAQILAEIQDQARSC